MLLPGVATSCDAHLHDGVCSAHYGFVLHNRHQRAEHGSDICRYADAAAVDAHMSGTWPPLKHAWESAGFSTTPGSPDFDVQFFQETDVGFMSK